jgi:hypothetical protein
VQTHINYYKQVKAKGNDTFTLRKIQIWLGCRSWPLDEGSFPPYSCHAITGSAAGGCQYLAVKMAANTEPVSALRPASGTKMEIWILFSKILIKLYSTKS